MRSIINPNIEHIIFYPILHGSVPLSYRNLFATLDCGHPALRELKIKKL